MSFVPNSFTRNITQKNFKGSTDYATKVSERVAQKNYTRRNDRNEEIRKKRLNILDTNSEEQGSAEFPRSPQPQPNEMDYYSSKDYWNIETMSEEIDANISQYNTQTEEYQYLMNNYAIMHYTEQQFAQTILITQKCVQAYNEFSNYSVNYEARVLSVLEQCIDYFFSTFENHVNSESINQNPSLAKARLSIPSPETNEQPILNTPSPPVRGGHTNENENNKITNSLNYEVPDSQHDFKPSSMRNSTFPGVIKGKKINTETGLIVYNAIQDIVRNSTDMNDLNRYILKSPISFEEDIKVDYLLGELAGNLEDIYYYFTDTATVPTGWTERRKSFFGFTKIGTPSEQTMIDPPKSIMKLVHDTKEQGYTNWILDACVSGRVSRQLGNRQYNLCNIWDPAKSAVTELIEDKLCNKDASLYEGQSYIGEACSLQPVSIPPTVVVDVDGYANKAGDEIYDWVNDQTGVSYYDMVYDPLLNNDALAKYDIYIKLRIFKGTPTKTSVPNIRVAICVYKGSELRNVYVIRSGFSVKELSIELYFIERSYKSKSMFQFTILSRNDTLKKLMESIVVLTKESKPDITNEEIYIMLCTLVLRFKSSGDHGTSNMVNLINHRFKLNCMFLSGDNLAYVYSIASNINYTFPDANNETITKIGKTPTGARYYAAKAVAMTEETEDDNEDDIATLEDTITGNHFMAIYMPSGDDDAKYTAKLQRAIECIFHTMPYSQYTPQDVTTITPEMLVALREWIQTTSGYLINEINKIQLDKANEVDGTKTTDILLTEISQGFIAQNIPGINMQTSVVDLFLYLQKNSSDVFTDLPKKKEFVAIVTHFCNTITFLSKFTRIQELSSEMIKSDIQALSPIMDLSPEIANTSQRSRRGVSSKLTQLSIQIQTSIRRVLTSSKNANITVEKLNEIAKTVDVNAKTTAYDLINHIKNSFIKNGKELTKQMELLGFTPEFIKSRLNSGLLQGHIDTIKAQIKENGGNIGPVLAEEFGNTLSNAFGNVVADFEKQALPNTVPDNDVLEKEVPVVSQTDTMEAVGLESKPNSSDLRSSVLRFPEFPRIPSAARPEYFTSFVNIRLDTKIIAKNIETYVKSGMAELNSKKRPLSVFGNTRNVVTRTNGGTTSFKLRSPEFPEYLRRTPSALRPEFDEPRENAVPKNAVPKNAVRESLTKYPKKRNIYNKQPTHSKKLQHAKQSQSSSEFRKNNRTKKRNRSNTQKNRKRPRNNKQNATNRRR
jgi:hypothetical protein